MLDKDSEGRFITGVAGQNYTAVDAISAASSDSLTGNALDYADVPIPYGQAIAEFETWRWDTPDKYSFSPWRAAGCRVFVVGGEVDSVVRCVSVPDVDVVEAREQSGDPTFDLIGNLIFAYPAYFIPAGDTVYLPKFSVPIASQFGLNLESGALAAVELHWMRGI